MPRLRAPLAAAGWKLPEPELPAHVVSGFMNKVQYMFADILPAELVAKMHRRMAEPDRHKKSEPA